jgi:hypothetical protein
LDVDPPIATKGVADDTELERELTDQKRAVEALEDATLDLGIGRRRSMN